MSGFADGVVSILVLIIFGATIAFVLNENVTTSGGQPMQPFFASLGNLWGRAISMMYGG